MTEAVMYIAAIKMPPGKLAAQVAHAAVACFRSATTFENRKDILRSWLNDQDSLLDAGQAKIVLRWDDALTDNMVAHAYAQNIPLAIVHDEGRTVLPAGTKTAIAVGPVLRTEIGPWQLMKLY